MRLLFQGQTSEPLPFLMVDETDHITGKTGLSPTVVISKNGASFAAPSGAVSEIGNGWYKVAGNATDTNTLGPILLHATATGADPTDTEFQVVAFNPRSAAFGASDATLANQNTIIGYLDTEIAAIKSKTDNLPSDPADASDITASFVTVNSTLGTIVGYIDTEVAAIKAKTDQLTFTVANQVDSNALSGSGSVNLTSILGTAITETSAGYLAAAFSYFLDVASPAKTVNDVGVSGSGLTPADIYTYFTSSSREDSFKAAESDIYNYFTGAGRENAFKATGFAEPGDEMNLPSATLTALFEDADVAQLVLDIQAKFDEASDLPITTIATAVWAHTERTLTSVDGNISFEFSIPGSPILFETGAETVYIKEKGLVVSLIANVDIEGETLVVIFENPDKTDKLVVADGSLTKVGNVVTLTLPDSFTDDTGAVTFAIRDAATLQVLGTGNITISYAPHEDA